VRFGFNHEAVNNNQSLGGIFGARSDGTHRVVQPDNAAQALVVVTASWLKPKRTALTKWG